MYPVMLDLRGRHCLVVGAGQVALRKLRGLLSEGAVVTVVAPSVIEGIAKLAGLGAITLHQRAFVDSDVTGCRLIMVATGDLNVDRQVAAAARAQGILVNVADDPEVCDFHLPARVQRGDLQLAVASGGGAPFAVRRLREILERRLGLLWAEWMAAAKDFRQRVQTRGLSPVAADERYDQFVAETVDTDTLAVRVPSAEELDRWSRPPKGHQCDPEVGFVSLVGAGPGHPGLLTVEGLRRLRGADVVVYDRLAIPALPLDLPDRIALHSVGKQAGNHPVPQDQINALLVQLGRMGKRVVRLKGGDPYVFGRGGEEALALRAAGIPCEVIPGVTAGIAVPAAAGIPVTYRGEAVRLTLLTAHEKGKAPQMRWDLLAQDAHATLVGYMGVSTLAEVSAALMTAGMSPATPAALVEQGTLAAQRTVRATLADLVSVAQRERIRPPAIFIIGQVVAHADQLDALSARPLRGARIGIFAPESPLVQTLRQAGAEVLVAPRPWTAAARLVLGCAPISGWIIRTQDELDALEREQRAGLGGAALWCVGGELAELAREHDWTKVIELTAGAEAGDLAALWQSLGGDGNAAAPVPNRPMHEESTWPCSS